MARASNLNEFLKTTQCVMPHFALLDADFDDVCNSHFNGNLRLHDSESITEGSFICTEARINEFLACFISKYQFFAHQNIFVTVIGLQDSSSSQLDVESMLFNNGFHVSAHQWQTRNYHNLDGNAGYQTTTFRKIPQTEHKLTSMSNLLIERDLHMDMLRECSGRSDAHVYRYVFAGSFIRPNDKVLDCACGLGYGSYILSSFKNCRQVTGVDICKESVGYANDVYGSAKLSYQAVNIDHFEQAALEQYDLITSFETIEHVVDYHAFFKLCLTHLKPDGRVVASVPYLWVDESGKDPNPYHFHEFDWQKFKALFLQYGFIIEARHHQTAPGGFKLTDSPRKWTEENVDGSESETEWLVIVATPNLSHELWSGRITEPYTNPEYTAPTLPVYVDFKNGYENPWLHRQIVQIGQRIKSDDVRGAYIEQLLKSSNESPLMLRTLQGYACKPDKAWFCEVEKLIDTTEVSVLSHHPFNLRWFTSLTFILAKQYYELGEFAKATHYFRLLTTVDTFDFCAILSVKSIESYWYLAKIYIWSDDNVAAMKCLTTAKSLIPTVSQAFHNSINNREDLVAPFLWPEMADIYDVISVINQLYIKMQVVSDKVSLLFDAEFLEQNKRFGLINLVDELVKPKQDDDQIQLQAIGKSYVNKLIAKVKLTNVRRGVYIWGTGIVAKMVFLKLKENAITVDGFIDNSSSSPVTFMELPVFSRTDIAFKSISLICITSVGSSEEIASSIMDSVDCVFIS
ncbi:class I SAM-dependent methyltransferase [Alteromonas sp. C1M14]|uniref:class I SAM-dependent methyltransferase n=1 Tax=Alteromonas sp. C1M14 TaxID=2841567 RepID=UPI001C09F4F0|nr:class I SAM-dependent methyltransferase [Alteromonas sp. C1M14]MBU2977955.1 class I SAM-dependent methyltransferase [Alteromonas sp. C1M14]